MRARGERIVRMECITVEREIEGKTRPGDRFWGQTETERYSMRCDDEEADSEVIQQTFPGHTSYSNESTTAIRFVQRMGLRYAWSYPTPTPTSKIPAARNKNGPVDRTLNFISATNERPLLTGVLIIEDRRLVLQILPLSYSLANQANIESVDRHSRSTMVVKRSDPVPTFG